MKNWIVTGLVAALAGAASAAPIEFTHEGTGGGFLDGENFGLTAPVHFVITAVGNTADRVNMGFGYYIDHTSASIWIEGVGTYDFLTPTRTFVNNDGQLVGFSRAGLDGADLFNGPVSGVFAAWDMTTSIGPISGDGSVLQWTFGDILVGNGLVLNMISGDTPVTFTAKVVPAPASLALLGLGVVAARRRR
ncbi:MAG: PEP-CTERM sorting domain-containing protein [Phycisphaerales bacterium]|nr:PEP-CTERM sorting domain-containing protein [Phycisphaerales bacterium]